MNILIVNLHSARNLGDDAIMYETLSGLQDVFPSAQITLAATDPQSWRKYSKTPKVEVVGSLTSWVVYLKNGYWRARWCIAFLYIPLFIWATFLYRLLKTKFLFGSQEKRHLLSAYYNANLVIGCGGGNLYANFWVSPFFILSLIELGGAIILNKKVVLLPQSIGPINGWLQRGLASLILNRVDKIMVREPLSMAFLQKTLNIGKRVVLIPDLALASTPLVNSHCSNVSMMIKKSSGLKIGVTVIDRAAQTRYKIFTLDQQEAYEAALALALSEISRKYGATIYLFSQCNGPDLAHNDLLALHRVFLHLRREGVPVVLSNVTDDFLELKAAYAHMSCVIGSRMHTAIFAFSLGIPMILIGYQPKAFGVMKWFGLSHFCYEIETLNHEQLFRGISELIENREEISLLIQEKYKEIQTCLRQWRYEIRCYA